VSVAGLNSSLGEIEMKKANANFIFKRALGIALSLTISTKLGQRTQRLLRDGRTKSVNRWIDQY